MLEGVAGGLQVLQFPGVSPEPQDRQPVRPDRTLEKRVPRKVMERVWDLCEGCTSDIGPCGQPGWRQALAVCALDYAAPIRATAFGKLTWRNIHPVEGGGVKITTVDKGGTQVGPLVEGWQWALIEPLLVPCKCGRHSSYVRGNATNISGKLPEGAGGHQGGGVGNGNRPRRLSNLRRAEGDQGCDGFGDSEQVLVSGGGLLHEVQNNANTGLPGRGCSCSIFGEVLSRHSASRRVRRVTRVLAGRRYSIHCMRHSHGCNVLEVEPLAIQAVSKQLGHRRLNTALIYASLASTESSAQYLRRAE
jgi:hypothetical protein